jgi:predicted phosphoribosyltransferase
VVCPLVPAFFGAVSRSYGRVDQVSDAEVLALLAAAGRRHPRTAEHPPDG